MAGIKLSRLELQIMELLWDRGDSSIRELQEALPAKRRPAYTTVQTTVYRMEAKGAVRRVKKVGNFHIFHPVVGREQAHRALIEDMLSLFGNSVQPVMAHLVGSGRLTLKDIKEAERALKRAGKDQV